MLDYYFVFHESTLIWVKQSWDPSITSSKSHSFRCHFTTAELWILPSSVSLQVIENIFLLLPYCNGKTTLSLLQVKLPFKCLKLALIFPSHEIFDCYGVCGLLFVVKCPVFLNLLIIPQNHCHSLVFCIGFFIAFLWIGKIILNSSTSLKLDLNRKF